MKRRGFTLIEALVAAAISVIAIGVGLYIYLSQLGAWAQGRGAIYSMSASQVAVKNVARELQEAILVTVSSDGQSVTYQLPKRDGTGDYVAPAVADGVNRSFSVLAGTLTQTIGGSSRILATNVLLKDPETNQAFTPFTGDGNALTRRVEIKLGTQKDGSRSQMVSHCASETVYLRNIPRKKST